MMLSSVKEITQRDVEACLEPWRTEKREKIKRELVKVPGIRGAAFKETSRKG